MTIRFVKDRVISVRENLEALVSGRKAIKKLLLCFETHNPILSRANHQRRRLNRTGIGKQPFRGVVEVEKHVDRDLPEDERIGIVASGLFTIVREHF